MPTNVSPCLFLFEPTVAITTLPGASSTDLTTLLGTDLADTFALDANKLSVDGLDGSDTVTASDAIDKTTINTGIDNDRVTLSGDFANGTILLGTGSDVASFHDLRRMYGKRPEVQERISRASRACPPVAPSGGVP